MENEKETAVMPQQPTPAKRTPQFTFDRKTLAMAVLAVISGVLSIFWGLWGGVRIGWAIAFLFYWISATVALAERGKRPGGYALCCGVTAAALSAVFVLTDNLPVCAFSFIAMLLLAAVWFTGLRGQRIPAGDLALIPHALRPIARGISFAPAAVRGLLSGESDRKKKAVQALVGALCAVPVLAAVLPLLMRSDAAFEGMIGDIFVDFWLRFLQLVLSLLLAALLFSFVLSLKQVPVGEAQQREKRGVATPALVAFLTVLSLCYVAYLVSQLAYFFSAFSGILPADYTFTFADYARRGFFELCAIAAINLCVMFFTILAARGDRPPLAVRILNCFIGLFTLLLIATALSKMVLYIRNYGMTVLRVGTGAFMVLLAVVFIAMLLRCFLPRVRVLQTALLAAGVILLALGAGDLNTRIANYNCDAYLDGRLQTVDVDYLASLDDAGVPALLRLAEDPLYGAAARAGLNDQILRLYEGVYDAAETFRPQTHAERRFYALHLPQIRAYRLLDAYLAAHPDRLPTSGLLTTARETWSGDWKLADGQQNTAPQALRVNGRMTLGKDGMLELSAYGTGEYWLEPNRIGGYVADADGAETSIILWPDGDRLIMDLNGRMLRWERVPAAPAETTAPEEATTAPAETTTAPQG